MERKPGGQDSQQITLSGEVEGQPSPRFGEPQAVFFGIDVTWRSKISDLQMNTAVAELWEDSFSEWDIDGRRVHLSGRGLRYRVSLRDGLARFMLDGPTAWEVGTEHTQLFWDRLHENDRSNIHVRATVQYLVSVKDEYDDLLKKLIGQLFNDRFYRSLGAPLDIAYLVDVRRGEIDHQIAIGPLRAHEVTNKVSAHQIDHIPERSIFVQVTGNYPKSKGDKFDVATQLRDLREFGRSLAEGLAS